MQGSALSHFEQDVPNRCENLLGVHLQEWGLVLSAAQIYYQRNLMALTSKFTNLPMLP